MLSKEDLIIIIFMNNFWTNIVRYPRFFISSMIGLILIILTPFRNLFKTPKLRLFLIYFSLVFISCLYFIIRNMVGL
jgi:hypothetical protein